MSREQLPNAITVARVLLVLPTAWLLWNAQYPAALVLMTIAGASDAVDGWLARRWRAQSRFGEAFDPLADKLLVAVMVVMIIAVNSGCISLICQHFRDCFFLKF